jgi:hypothetical protein
MGAGIVDGRSVRYVPADVPALVGRIDKAMRQPVHTGRAKGFYRKPVKRTTSGTPVGKTCVMTSAAG